MSRQIIRWWLIGSVLLAVVAAPFLARGDANLRRQRRQNQQEIAAMPESERNRLKRNFETYQSLTEAERNQLRQLHQTLDANRSGDNELNETLNAYREWLTTLEPFQRDRLNQIEDPNERLVAMREVVREQRVRSTERAFPGGRGGSTTRWGIPTLTVDEYRRVMEELEKIAMPSLSLEKRSKLEGTSGIDRHYMLIKLIAQDELSDKVKSVVMQPPKEFRTIVNRIDDLVETSEVREYFREESNRFFTNEQKLARIIGIGLSLELSDTRKRELKTVNDEQLMLFFETLPEDEQDRLLTLEASDFHSDLVNQFQTQSNADQDRVTLSDIFSLFRPPFGPGGRGPGPSNGPRDDGPRGQDGERPGFKRPGPGGDRERFGDGNEPRRERGPERPRGPRPERGEF